VQGTLGPVTSMERGTVVIIENALLKGQKKHKTDRQFKAHSKGLGVKAIGLHSGDTGKKELTCTASDMNRL